MEGSGRSCKGMASVPPRRFWIPAFATEWGIRSALQCLYVGMVGSSENARSLIEHDPSELNYASATGNKLTKSCFSHLLRWLSRVREFAVSEEVFREQILEAVRSPARFLLSVRADMPATTKMSGLVFAKSPPFYDRYYQNQVLKVSMVCPDLGTVMSLRHTVDTLSNVDYGAYEFSGVLPIPFTNRIRPFAPTTRKSESPIELSRLHSLKASWGDFPTTARSWSFENYAQIQSTQTGRRHLGIARVLSGRLMALPVPRMILQSPNNDSGSNELVLTESLVAGFGGDESRIRDLIGKQVRVLAVFWYGYGFSKRNSRLPEAFLMEKASSLEDSRLDDAIGFVRTRQRLSESQFLSRFNEQDLARLPPELIRRKSGSLEWNLLQSSHDRILSAFLEQMRFLNASRIVEDSSGVSRTILLGDVIDRQKLSSERLVEIVAADAFVSGTLFHLIKSDDSGVVHRHWSEIARAIGDSTKESRASILWLRDMGLVGKREGFVRITPRGRLVWYSANKGPLMSSIEKFLSGRRGSFDMIQITKSVSYPKSVILSGLGELEEKGRMRSFRASWREFKHFWTILSGEGGQPPAQEDTPMLLSTLSVLGTAADSLSTQKILEELREQDLRWDEEALLASLNYLRSQGRVSLEREPSGNEMWLYPRERRITDLFSRQPEKPFTLDEIVQANHGSSEETERILKGLAVMGQITYFGGYWFTGSWAKTTDKILKSLCERLVRALIRESGGAVSEARLIYELNHFLPGKLDEFKITGGNVRQTSERLVQAMVEDRIIVRRGWNYELGPG